mmetsp:Transcript_25232/g.71869  ORF Transcript_25232/g.71869 Transcript_25232/m.71869 type:complete len:268 (-) Transcript_25232:2113-2916(-)
MRRACWNARANARRVHVCGCVAAASAGPSRSATNLKQSCSPTTRTSPRMHAACFSWPASPRISNTDLLHPPRVSASSSASASAPASASTSTALAWPAAQAASRGVRPRRQRASRRAPARQSRSQTSSCPASAAKCRGPRARVGRALGRSGSPSGASRSQRSCKSALTMPTCPASAAHIKAVQPPGLAASMSGTQVRALNNAVRSPTRAASQMFAKSSCLRPTHNLLLCISSLGRRPFQSRPWDSRPQSASKWESSRTISRWPAAAAK